MSWLRKRWVIFRNPQAHIEFQGPVYLGPGFSLDMPKGGTFIVAPGVEFRRRFRAEIGPNARIVIGPECFFTYDVIMACSTSIEIGARVSIGQCAYIVDGKHNYRDPNLPLMAQGYEYRPLQLGDDVTILSKCTIVNSIGDHGVVAANAVVAKPVPPYCVVAGVPARVIDYFGPPGAEPPGFIPREASGAPTSG